MLCLRGADEKCGLLALDGARAAPDDAVEPGHDDQCAGSDREPADQPDAGEPVLERLLDLVDLGHSDDLAGGGEYGRIDLQEGRLEATAAMLGGLQVGEVGDDLAGEGFAQCRRRRELPADDLGRVGIGYRAVAQPDLEIGKTLADRRPGHQFVEPAQG
ncbi:hypothetical protein ASE63_23070 [Bosea sp. Root381]|nr:hypothetical protein ASE63_23070 [Bosea sp. Root381]